jgi:hypothetical protein
MVRVLSLHFKLVCSALTAAGSYFAPILEYLRTGELHIPASMSRHCIAREARFYMIDMPFNEAYPTEPQYNFVSGFALSLSVLTQQTNG